MLVWSEEGRLMMWREGWSGVVDYQGAVVFLKL